MNRILWSGKALRQLRKIAPADGAMIRASVDSELSDLRQARNVKCLTGHACGYRLRVGRYRVLFNVIDGMTQIILIEEVRKRDERTY